jgi:hypothetical protein
MQVTPELIALSKSTLAYLSPFFLAAIAGLGTLYKLERDKRQSIEQKLNDNKIAIYSKFIDDYTQLFFRQAGQEKSQQEIEEVVRNVQHFARHSMIYASDEVVDKFSRMYRLQLTEVDPSEGLRPLYERLDAFTDVVKAMRRELGHSKTRLSYETIGGLLVTDYDKTNRSR